MDPKCKYHKQGHAVKQMQRIPLAGRCLKPFMAMVLFQLFYCETEILPLFSFYFTPSQILRVSLSAQKLAMNCHYMDGEVCKLAQLWAST